MQITSFWLSFAINIWVRPIVHSFANDKFQMGRIDF